MSYSYIKILAFLILLVESGFAQKSALELKGDKFFNKMAYKNAVSKYEEAGKLSNEGLRNLAISHLKLRNFAASEKKYAEFMALNAYNDDDIYNYAALLKANSKYDESEIWMKRFVDKNPNDSRSQDFINNGKNVLDLLKDEGRYSIKNITENSENQDFGPSYWKDKLVFASNSREIGPIKKSYSWNGKPYLDIYVADIDDSGNIKNTHNLNRYHKENINRDMHEGPATFARNGNLMAFTRNNYVKKSEQGIHKLEIYFAEFNNGVWQNETAFKLNDSEYSVGHPWLSEDGNLIYFASDMPGGLGGTDIYKIERVDGGEWGEPINLGEKVNTIGNEMFPFYHEKLELFMFSSNSHSGLGGLDLFLINAPNHKMGKIVNMGSPLNSSFDDFAIIADPEMKKGYFSSNRDGGKGDDDIYQVEFLKPFIFVKTIEGVAYNGDSIITDGAEIALYDENGNLIAETVADSNGRYSFEIENFDLTYYIESKKDQFDDGKTQKIDVSGPSNIVQADVVMERKPIFNLICIIKSNENDRPIPDVKVKIVNDNIPSETVLKTSDEGKIAMLLNGYKMNDSAIIVLQIEKDGYLPKKITYNQILVRSGNYIINEVLEPIEIVVGNDLSDIIAINPIYFDYNKYFIRKDASQELDKIVDIMNKNPNLVIELGSHTDCRGTSSYNIKLSDNRAKSSAAYIASRITNPERIYGIGYGESVLKNECDCEGTKISTCSEAEHQLNRRTEFIIVSTEGMDKVSPEKLELLKKNGNFVSGANIEETVSLNKRELKWNDLNLVNSSKSSAKGKNEYILVVGSFKNESSVIEISKQLESNGFKVYRELTSGFQRVGVFVYCANQDELEKVRLEFSSTFLQDTWILKK